MAKIKRSYKDLKKFDDVSTEYMIKEGYYIDAVPAKGEDPGKKPQFTDKTPTKLILNIKNVGKQIAKLFEDFQEKVTEIQLDHCAVDESKKPPVIMYNDRGGLCFTVEKQKELNKKIKELWNEETEIHSRITEGDFSLTDEEKEAFSGIVIPDLVPDPVEE